MFAASGRLLSKKRLFTTGKRWSSNLSSIKTVGVIGAGQMGSGIAQVTAQTAELKVIIYDPNQKQIEKSLKGMEGSLTKIASKGGITEQQKIDSLARVRTTTNLSELTSSCEFIIEAVPENLELKRSIFESLARDTKEGVILATNTSSISITKIAAITGKRANEVVGMHFMNPVPIMKLVEIIPAIQTSPEVLQTTIALAQKMGKITTTSIDMPGFIANRLLMPYINEAAQALADGLGTKEDIDTTMKFGCNMPMGPLTLADFIGLDTCLAIMKVLHTEFGDSKYRPAPILVKYVDAGWLGKKTGKGFYTY